MAGNLYNNLPESPGVYLFKDSSGRILYIGKAANLRRRAASYFTRPHDYKIENLISRVRKIDFQKTDTTIEALILESKLIKRHKPQFNVKEKDDKSFLFVEITGEKFPRVLLSRGKGDFGPFTSATSIRESLRIIRRIFPYGIHSAEQIRKSSTAPKLRRRPCFDYEIGLCPGTCIGAVSQKDYLKNIRKIKLFFDGKKKQIIKTLIREMERASRSLEFEKAEKLRRQLFALQHIQDVALIADDKFQFPKSRSQSAYRIEGYDISNISGTSATGSMVVAVDGVLNKKEYRRFKIATINSSNDVGMLKEVLRRRFSSKYLQGGWFLPNLILIDGGLGQVNAAKSVLNEAGLKIRVVGIAKGAKRKNNRFIGRIPKGIDAKVLIRLRNEAHRFAIAYHKKLRSVKSIQV